jgi:hypothetical protein
MLKTDINESERWREADAALRAQRSGPRGLSRYADVSGRSAATLRRWARVARSFPAGRRRADLSFSHHELVAGRADRLELLAEAAVGGWSVAEFRAFLGSCGPLDSREGVRGELRSMGPATIDATLDYLRVLDRLGPRAVARLGGRLEALSDMAGLLAKRACSADDSESEPNFIRHAHTTDD